MGRVPRYAKQEITVGNPGPTSQQGPTLLQIIRDYAESSTLSVFRQFSIHDRISFYKWLL